MKYGELRLPKVPLDLPCLPPRITQVMEAKRYSMLTSMAVKLLDGEEVMVVGCKDPETVLAHMEYVASGLNIAYEAVYNGKAKVLGECYPPSTGTLTGYTFKLKRR